MVRKNRHASSKEPKSRQEKQKALPKLDLPPISILYQENPKLEIRLPRETFSEKLSRISESNFFMGGGVAMALAAYAFLLTPALKFSIVLLAVAWVVITISIYRHNFFEGKSLLTQLVSNGIISLLVGGGLCLIWLWLRQPAIPPSNVEKQKASAPATQKTPDDQLARIEFSSEATKKLQALFFRIELKRPFLPDELGHFRMYFEFVNGSKIEMRVGCQSRFDKNIGYVTLEQSWSDDKNAKHTAKPYSTIVQGNNSQDLLNCSVDTSKEKFPYQTTNDLEKRQVRIYATDSLVEKIKSISLVADNYKILSYSTDKFVVNFQEPDVKWFVPLLKPEKAIQWQMIGLKAPSEKIGNDLKVASDNSGTNYVWGWYIDFAKAPPIRMPSDWY